MRNLSTLVNKIYSIIVVSLMRIILIFLFVLAVVSTCTIAMDISEKTYYISDNILKNIVLLICWIIFIFFIKKFGLFSKKENKNITIILCILLYTVASVWIVLSRYTPRSDQMAVYACINALKNKDFSGFDKGGYFYRFPYQVGIVYIYYLWSIIFGYRNVIALQMLNALAIVLFYKKIGDLCAHIGFGTKYKDYVLILGIFFYPLIMYSSFIYGNLLGLGLSAAALDYEIQFLNKGRKIHGILSALCILLGIFAKKNYVIFLLGMIIYAALVLISRIEINKIIYLTFLLIVLIGASSLLSAISNKITGIEESEPMSSWSYVAMGLSEGPRANGWQTNFEVDSYEASNYNTEIQSELALENIRESIKKFIQNPQYAKEFFVLKIASEWNNPTFQCHWINQVCDYDEKQSDVVKAINSLDAGKYAYGYLDAFMIIVLFGALLLFWINDDFKNSELILATIFIGGFLFHIFWEAKGQYTLPYYVLMFPYSIKGYAKLVRQKSLNKRKIFLFVGTVIVFSFIIIQDIDLLTKDTVLWQEYIAGV